MADPALPAKPAATVMLLRDADTTEGIEVFMLRRTKAAAFASGMYVFPGGKVDDADGEGDAGYVIAAIRECYEEAGVLLATDADGRMVTDGHPAFDLPQCRPRRNDRPSTTLRAARPDPAIDDLVWISHWITPVRRGTTPLRHPLLRRGGTTRPDIAPRRQRDHRQRVGRPSRCVGSSSTRRTDDDAADDQEPRVRRRPPQRCVARWR